MLSNALPGEKRKTAGTDFSTCSFQNTPTEIVMTELNTNQEAEKKATRSIALTVGLILIALYAVVYIIPLGHRPLILPDESRYAEIPREMLANDRWMVLKQAGLPYYEKSPLGYWAKALSISIFGHNNFAVRFPSALSAGLTALVLFWFVRRKRQDAALGVLAATVYLSCAQVFGIGTFAVLDTIFSLFVTLSMIFYLAAQEREGKGRIKWLVLSGLACGAAFMSKGFTAIAIPAITLVAWHAWERTFKRLFIDWIIPTIMAAALIAPFAYALHVHNPDFWRYFFWTEHIQRFLDPHGGQHKLPIWFFFPVFILGAQPWIFFIVPIIARTKRFAATDRVTRYCICWFAMPFLFFSVCKGKLPTYILPCFAPFALMTAEAVWSYREEYFKLKKYAVFGAGFMVTVLAAFLCWLPFSRESHFRQSVLEDSQSIVIGVAVVVGAGILYWAAKAFEKGRGLLRPPGLVAVSFFFMFLASIYFLPNGIEDRKSPTRLLQTIKNEIPEDAFLIVDEQMLSIACWYFQRDDIPFFGRTGELEYGLVHANAVERYMQSPAVMSGIIKEKLLEGRSVVIIAGDSNFRIFADDMLAIAPHVKRSLSAFVWALYLPEDMKE